MSQIKIPQDRGLSPEMVHGLDMYFNHRISPSGFLYQVLCNDLLKAAQKADKHNRATLAEIVLIIDEIAPPNSWYSIDNVVRWLQIK
jgi:hypothetical protein